MSALGLNHPFDGVPAEGAVERVADGVLWVRMPLPFALDHINLWLLRDDDGWTVVDCGVASNRTRTAWDAIFATALDGLPVTRVLVTHFHPDHMGLADWIACRFGAPLWITRAEWLFARLLCQDHSPEQAEAAGRFYRGAGLDAGQLAAMAARGNAYPRGVPSVPAAFQRIRHGDHITIGGRLWQVVEGGGHSPEHACLWCAEAGILIAGDQVLPRISPNVSVWPAEPEADPLDEFVDALRRLRDLPPDALVLPSHGRPFHGLHTRIDQLIAHHDERLEEAVEACRAKPASAMDVTAVLFRRALDTHQLSFAVGEALAHLNHLVGTGRLTRRIDPDGVIRFAAT